MSLLVLALGATGLGGLAFRILAPVAFKAAFGGALPVLRAYWKPLLAVAAVLAIVVTFLILRGEVRHRDKIIAAQTALIGDVRREVDRGVGKPTIAADAPLYVRSFVDNLATVKAALDRQSAALSAAKADAEAHVAAAHEAARPTAAQAHREDVRHRIADPARTTGLSAQEWSQL